MRVVETEDEHAEARFVAAEIAGAGRGAATARREIAVVYRTNAQSRVLEDVLVRQGDRLPGDRRPALLRARRDQGRDRLPAGARQPVRRRLAAARSRTGRGAGSATPRSRGSQRYADGLGISLWEAIGRAEEAGLAAASLTRGARASAALMQSLMATATDADRRRARRGGARAHRLPRGARGGADDRGARPDREPRGARRRRARVRRAAAQEPTLSAGSCRRSRSTPTRTRCATTRTTAARSR